MLCMTCSGVTGRNPKKGSWVCKSSKTSPHLGEIWDSENTLVGTNISPSQGTLEDGPLPKVRYVRSLEGTFELKYTTLFPRSVKTPPTHFYTLGIQSPNLRMVMEPQYFAEEVIVHPNHPLTRWLDHKTFITRSSILRDLLTMVFNHLLNGIILQVGVGKVSLKYLLNFTLPKTQKNQPKRQKGLVTIKEPGN